MHLHVYITTEHATNATLTMKLTTKNAHYLTSVNSFDIKILISFNILLFYFIASLISNTAKCNTDDITKQ